MKLFNKFVSDSPNEETIVAMRESEDMLKSGDAIKFDSVDSLFQELKS